MSKKLLCNFFLILSLFLLSGCDTELVSNLSERQANEIVALLEQNNIDAHKIKGEKNIFSVRVDQSYMSDSIELLNAYDLPSADHVEIADQFPADSMVSTPLGEKVRLISSIEQRLGQTILELDNITTARVHLGYPIKGDSDENSTTPSASVLIIYKNAINEAEYIDKIKRLIKNSLSTIQYEDISVVIFKKGEVIRPSKLHSSISQWIYPIAGLLIILLCAGSASFYFYRRKIGTIKSDSSTK